MSWVRGMLLIGVGAIRHSTLISRVLHNSMWLPMLAKWAPTSVLQDGTRTTVLLTLRLSFLAGARLAEVWYGQQHRPARRPRTPASKGHSVAVRLLALFYVVCWDALAEKA
jgi:hypothetical protein